LVQGNQLERAGFVRFQCSNGGKKLGLAEAVNGRDKTTAIKTWKVKKGRHPPCILLIYMFCSFTNTSRHDITEILLKVAFKHHRTNQCIITVYYTCCKFYNMQCFWNNDIIIAINYQRKLTHTNVYCPWKVECKAGVFPFSPSMFLLPLFCLFHLRLLLTLISYPILLLKDIDKKRRQCQHFDIV
jgi:hypothetical protein